MQFEHKKRRHENEENCVKKRKKEDSFLNIPQQMEWEEKNSEANKEEKEEALDINPRCVIISQNHTHAIILSPKHFQTTGDYVDIRKVVKKRNSRNEPAYSSTGRREIIFTMKGICLSMKDAEKLCQKLPLAMQTFREGEVTATTTMEEEAEEKEGRGRRKIMRH